MASQSHTDEIASLDRTDTEAVIKSQLVANTGRHILDSGSAYGRHWEENQENPPWERAEMRVEHGYVVMNVYHYMERMFGRDDTAVAVEDALYSFADEPAQKRESWLQIMKRFAEDMSMGTATIDGLMDMGLSAEDSEAVIHVQRSVDDEPSSINTYENGNGSLSQILQMVSLGGLYADYWMVQVHGGCDVRGGYTAPRVYYAYDIPIPSEFGFAADNHEWQEAESCLFRDDTLIYQPRVDPEDLLETVRDRVGDTLDGEPVESWVDFVIESAYKRQGRYDGAVYRLTDEYLDTVSVY